MSPMGRDVSALSGEHLERQQVPVTLVQIEIPSDTIRIHSLDVPLWLNVSTNALSTTSGGGAVEFSPVPGFRVPEIEENDSDVIARATLELSNLAPDGASNGPWFGRIAAGNYYDAPVTIWKGNLSIAPGGHPDAASAVGSIVRYVGRIETIDATERTARVPLVPFGVHHTVTLPRHTYTIETFPLMPRPGKKIKFGFTTRTL